MPKRGALTRLLVNEWDFSGQSNSVEVDLTTARVETTPLQATGVETVSTNMTGKISQNGYFVDKGAGYLEQELQSQIANGTTLYVAALFATDIAACPAYVARATNAESMKISAPVDGVLTMSGAWFDGLGIKRGLRAYSGTVSATGAQTYIDLGAPGAAGGLCWLFVQAKTGTITNASFIVECDDNTGFTTPTTKATFTFSALGAYELAMSGVVDRYIRLKVNSLGGATNITAVLITGAAGIQY